MSARHLATALALLLALIAVAPSARAAGPPGETPGTPVTTQVQATAAPVPQLPSPTGDTLDLSGTWKFKGDWLESGLAEGWQKPEYDDTAWKELQVPASWEQQGITTSNPRWPGEKPDDGYNGYAWYRKHFTVPAEWAALPLTLRFAAVDDYDWVYVNGQMVGSTTTGDPWNQPRRYSVLPDLVKPGADNVIAIRVFDKSGPGGITAGPLTLTKGSGEQAAAPEPNRYTNVTEQVVRIGGGVTIPADQKVNGDVVAIGGSADISGYVTGDVVAIGGSVHARPGSWIEGDAVAIGGSIEKAEDAHIGGETVTAVPGVVWRPEWVQALPKPFRGPGSFLAGLLVWTFLTLVAVLLFRSRLEVMAEALPLHPGRAAGYGLLGLAVTPAALISALVAEVFVIVVLAITIVGILAIPAVALAMVVIALAPIAVLLIGMAGVFLSLGRAMTAQVGRPDTHPLWAALIGVVIVCFGGAIPWVWIGKLIWVTVAIFGFGLALMTGIGSEERYSYRGMRLPGRRARREEPQPEIAPAASVPHSPEPAEAEAPPAAEPTPPAPQQLPPSDASGPSQAQHRE